MTAAKHATKEINNTYLLCYLLCNNGSCDVILFISKNNSGVDAINTNAISNYGESLL